MSAKAGVQSEMPTTVLGRCVIQAGVRCVLTPATATDLIEAIAVVTLENLLVMIPVDVLLQVGVVLSGKLDHMTVKLIVQS